MTVLYSTASNGVEATAALPGDYTHRAWGLWALRLL